MWEYLTVKVIAWQNYYEKSDLRVSNINGAPMSSDKKKEQPWQEFLSGAGAQGWELVNTISIESSIGFYAFFKRPLKQ